MSDNKCDTCHGLGVIILKLGKIRQEVVCPTCGGSGSKGNAN
jgi:DnaJ-class molecular chaperone